MLSAYEPGPQMLPQQAPRLYLLPLLGIVFWISTPNPSSHMQEQLHIFQQ